MFDGFRSRCSTPASWAAWTARASFCTKSAAAAAGRSDRRSRRSSDPPGTYSRAQKGTPPASLTSKILTMLGWSSRAIASVSARNRRRALAPARFVRIIFNATSRFRATCRAR
jgi:hypothetical protein